MIDFGESARLDAPPGRMPELTTAASRVKGAPPAHSPNLYAEHMKCIWLADELENAINERQTKAVIGAIVRRTLKAVEDHFRHEEELFVQFGYGDGPRHSELHSTLLAKFRRLSDELDTAARTDDWIRCGSDIVRMLGEHLKEEQVIYGL